MAEEQNYLEQFVDLLLKEVNLENLPEDFQKEYKEKVLAQLQEHLGLALINALDEKGVEEYKKLFSDEKMPSQKEAQKFLEQNVPQYQKVVEEALADFARLFFQANQKAVKK